MAEDPFADFMKEMNHFVEMLGDTDRIVQKGIREVLERWKPQIREWREKAEKWDKHGNFDYEMKKELIGRFLKAEKSLEAVKNWRKTMNERYNDIDYLLTELDEILNKSAAVEGS